MRNNLPSAVYNLHTRSPEELWGVSSRSVYLSLCSVVDGQPMADHLNPHHKTTVLRTNDERDSAEVTAVHRFLHEELGLITESGALSDRGRLVLASEEPIAAVRLAAAQSLKRVRYFLREFHSLEAEQLPRGELETMTRNSRDTDFVAPLLSSLGFVDLYPEGIILYDDAISQTLNRATQKTDSVSVSVGLVDALTDIEIPSLVARVASQLASKKVSVGLVEDTYCLDGLIAANRGRHRTPKEVLEEALNDVRSDVEDESATLKAALDSNNTASRSSETVDGEVATEAFQGDDPKESEVAVVLDLLATVHGHPSLNQVFLEPLNTSLGVDQYGFYQILSAVPGVKCNIRDGLLATFDAVPASTGTDKYEERRGDLFDAIHMRLSWLDVLETAVNETPRVRESVVGSLLSQVDQDVVAPTYFVYTLPDPDALGEELMGQYINDKPELQRERARLKRWKNQRGNDSRRFTEMTDRLFTHGQECDLEERLVRIMTPYDDDTFSEYTSQLRSLLRDGYEIRLLTRHTKRRWEWERLRDNLLGDLEENRENVTIRTYSRYKQYQRITGDTSEAELDEFGIHAKLQTIGHASEGAALLGSANFMENSYNWNPECGVYTENANFVTAVIEFFDHVWELSEADEVDLSSLQQIPERSFYPSYYT